MKKETVLRGIIVAISTIALGIGVGCFRISCFGSDPYTAMNSGMSNILQMSFGGYQLMINAILIVIMLFVARELIGFGTVFNMVCVGYSADATLWLLKPLLQSLFGTAEGTELPIVVRVAFLCLAFFMFCFFIGAYIAANLGIAPYDALSIILEKFCKGKLTFRMARIMVDCLSVLIAFAAGAYKGIQWQIIGIGTIGIACFSGPLISICKDWTEKKMLEKYIKKG